MIYSTTVGATRRVAPAYGGGNLKNPPYEISPFKNSLSSSLSGTDVQYISLALRCCNMYLVSSRKGFKDCENKNTLKAIYCSQHNACNR
jgi:hypothetical protein